MKARDISFFVIILLVASCSQEPERVFFQRTLDYLSEGKNLWELSIYSTSYSGEAIAPKTDRDRLHSYSIRKKQFPIISNTLQFEFDNLGMEGVKLKVDSIRSAIGYPSHCLARRFSFEFNHDTYWIHVVFEPNGSSFLIHSYYWTARTQQEFILPLREKL